MQILNSRLKKARIRKEKRDRFWLKFRSRRIVRFIRKQYKKTGSTVITVDPYKFNENLLSKVLEMLKKEHQLNFEKVEDYYVVYLKETTQAPQFNKVQPVEISIEPQPIGQSIQQEQKTLSVKKEADKEEYKPF